MHLQLSITEMCEVYLCRNNQWRTVLHHYGAVGGRKPSHFTQGDLRLPVVKVYQMAKEILSALVMMQSLEKPIYHRDIKPNNIVWDKRERFVLIDFNIATNSQRDKNEVGTLHYIAPDLGKAKMLIGMQVPTLCIGSNNL